MITLEQVEKLREKANVSYDDAKAALTAADGDLLEAMIWLEKQGKVAPPSGGGYYSNEKSENTDSGQAAESACKNEYRGETFMGLLNRFGKFCGRLIHKGNTNTFEVFKGDECKASVPVTVLVLLLLVAFWVTIPLLIVGLFFGLRYRFNGPDLGRESVNKAMDSAAKVADDIRHSVTDEKK